MPFGAEPGADGVTRFRLWAPGARDVELRLEGPGVPVPVALERDAEGWYRAERRDAPAGTRYRYRIDGELDVPDPASRFQPDGPHGPSEVVDPAAHRWRDAGWTGRPFHETVLYELHAGAFDPAGDLDGVVRHLDHLVELGVTALELLPLSECPGRWNWGYDGVLPFAPTRRHGRPEDLKRLVEEAHARDLMVFLDVVYNHFGPDGNYLARYAPGFFTDRHHTPWGAAIDFETPEHRPVREYFIHNALYWLEEFHLDGLRLDAVHAIHDGSDPDLLTELARRVRGRLGDERHVHLVLENDANEAHRLERDPRGRPIHYTAQWNDDVHHAYHVVLTGEMDGYYEDVAPDPLGALGRCLTEGFAAQGEPSRHRGGSPRGEPSAGLPPSAFVAFLQNHDQVGNRAFGERIDRLASAEALRAATTVLLLAPAPPMLFMGQEWAAPEPFPFFCDFGPELAAAVREGRRREFARFPAFRDEPARARIPDPGAEETFRSAVLDWSALDREPHREWLGLHRELLALRHRHVVPLLADADGHAGRLEAAPAGLLHASWRLAGGARLELVARLAGDGLEGLSLRPRGTELAATHALERDATGAVARLPAHFAGWWLETRP